jgi:hypothetical protein
VIGAVVTLAATGLLFLVLHGSGYWPAS